MRDDRSRSLPARQGETAQLEPARSSGGDSLVDLAHGLDKFAPVQGAEKTEAVDGMTDRNLVGGLVLALLMHESLDGKPLSREPLFEPGPGEMHRRALTRQPLAKLGHKGAGQRQARLSHVRHHHYETRGVFLNHLLQAIDPQVGQITMLPADHQAGGDPAQVFN